MCYQNTVHQRKIYIRKREHHVVIQPTDYECFQGGMKAVVWVDTIQLMVMVAGQLAILIQVTINQGGMTQIFNIAQEGGRINFRE